MTLRLVIAENDKERSLLVEDALKQGGFSMRFAQDGNEALKLIYEEKPDLILLNSAIPPMGGVRMCRWIKMDPAIANTPIMILSSDEDYAERAMAFDAGADDYMSGPLDSEELIKRIKVCYQSNPFTRTAKVLKAGNIEMVLDRWLVLLSGKPVELTVKEYQLLQELLEAKGSVLSREILLERVWGYGKWLDIHTRTLDVHMSRLRGKLGASGKYITTIRNVGYRIDIAVDKEQEPSTTEFLPPEPTEPGNQRQEQLTREEAGEDTKPSPRQDSAPAGDEEQSEQQKREQGGEG